MSQHPVRRNISSRSPYEDVVGYSRAVRVGGSVWVAGTTATVDGEEVGRAHRELFDVVRPVSTMVQVTAFAHPDLLVEVEVDAHVAPPGWRARLGS